MTDLPEDAELDALMQRIRAELAAQQRLSAESTLSRDTLPQRLAEFAALPEDAFIEAGFRVALGRSPTSEEASSAGWALRAGTSRARHLAALLALPEAKARGSRIPGVARQAALDRFTQMVTDSGLPQRLRPALRVARGLRRLVRVAPRLARLDETLAGLRQAAVAEQTQRFAMFAQQQVKAMQALEARVAALEASPSPDIIPAAMPLAELEALLARAAPGARFTLSAATPTVGSATSDDLGRIAAAHGFVFDPPSMRRE